MLKVHFLDLFTIRCTQRGLRVTFFLILCCIESCDLISGIRKEILL